MDLEKVKKSLESAGEEIASTQTLESLPSKFYDSFILQGLRIDRIEPNRLLCTLTVPPRLLNGGAFLHGGATASLIDLVGSAAFFTAGAQTKGSPLEISVAYLDAAFANNIVKDTRRRKEGASQNFFHLTSPSHFTCHNLGQSMEDISAGYYYNVITMFVELAYGIREMRRGAP